MNDNSITVHMSPLMFNTLALIAKNEKRELDAQALYFIEKSVEKYFLSQGIFANEKPVAQPKPEAKNEHRYVRIKINKKRSRGWKWSDEARQAFSERQKLAWAKRKMTV